jgi:hypothetical protein
MIPQLFECFFLGVLETKVTADDRELLRADHLTYEEISLALQVGDRGGVIRHLSLESIYLVTISSIYLD